MQRRNFCKLLAGTAAAKAIHLEGQSATASEQPPGFSSLQRTYTEYCSTPAAERTFYTLVDGKIVEQKLDEAKWSPTEWGEPPELPVTGGSWDGVPLIAPVPGLEGTGPYNATWDSLLQYEVPEWYKDAKLGIWAHWSPQCVPEDNDWFGRNMYLEGSKQYQYHLEHYGPQSRFGYKDFCAQWTLLNWDPEALMQRYKNAGARSLLRSPVITTVLIPGIQSIIHGTRCKSGRIAKSSAHGLQLPASKSFASAYRFITPAIGGGFNLRTELTKRGRLRVSPMMAD